MNQFLNTNPLFTALCTVTRSCHPVMYTHPPCMTIPYIRICSTYSLSAPSQHHISSGVPNRSTKQESTHHISYCSDSCDCHFSPSGVPTKLAPPLVKFLSYGLKRRQAHTSLTLVMSGERNVLLHVYFRWRSTTYIQTLSCARSEQM